MGSVEAAGRARRYLGFRARWGRRMRRAADKIRLRLWLRYLVFLLFMEGLSEVLGHWSDLLPLRDHLLFEAPLLLALYWAFGFALRPGKLSAIVAALPLVLAYVASDVYFVAYGDDLRIIDLRNLPELLKVLHFAGNAALLLALALPVVLPARFR